MTFCKFNIQYFYHHKKYFARLHQKQHGQQAGGGDCLTLVTSCEIPPGVLHPALGFSAKKGHRTNGASPEKAHEGI